MLRSFIRISVRIVVCLIVFIHSHKVLSKPLFINEIQVANIDRFIDPSYNYGGWIELYNPGDSSIPLNGYIIRHTDSDGYNQQCTLTSSHGNIPAKGYSVLWFDHHSKDGYYGPKAGTQIPFKLDADGGIIELLDSHNAIIDVIDYPPCITRCSWIRATDGSDSFGWTNQATPNASNDTCCTASERVEAPIVNSSDGIFSDHYYCIVSIPQNCTLYYTTDGSTPVPGRSSISTNGVFTGTENAIYRFILAREGFLHSPVVTRSFFKSEGDFSLPILSVNTAPANFFDDTIGVYVIGTNGRVANNSKVKANQNMDWERPVNVEYFVPDSNMAYHEVINQEVTFKVFGGWTRFNAGNDDFKHRSSFKLKSSKVYEGTNAFGYPIFDSKPYIKLKNILARNGGQDNNGRIWDGAIQELIRTSGIYIDCQAWQPAHVFLNGKYLGMMNLREESNKQFAYSNYGIDTDEIDQWENDVVVKEGDLTKLYEWHNLSKKLTGNAADSTVWNKISDLVDIDEYCNYMAAQIYMGNRDWLRGGFKNIKGFRAKDENGKFHLVMYDVDAGFGDTDMILQVFNKGTGSLPTNFKNMLKYEPFKKQFIDAYCIMDGSVFEYNRCLPIITAMKNTVNKALQLENLSADARADLLISRFNDNEVRKPALKQSLKTAFNLGSEYTVNLKSNIQQGAMLLNGQEIPTKNFNGYLFPPIVLTSSAPEGYLFKEWNINGERVTSDSILHLSEEYPSGEYEIEAIYQYVETKSLSPIRINEVSAGNDTYINEYGKKNDWIELYNTSDQDFDLAGIYLSDNVLNPHKFQIPSFTDISTIIPAHGYKVIWCDGEDSKSQLHASFKLGNRDNSFISISDANGLLIDSLSYKSQPRWHTYGRFPDGGSSLAMLERPTIAATNRICTSTVLESSKGIVDGIDTPIGKSVNRQIETIRYYNLSGQQISNLEGEHIVIQYIIYKDGSFESRKIICHK